MGDCYVVDEPGNLNWGIKYGMNISEGQKKSKLYVLYCGEPKNWATMGNTCMEEVYHAWQKTDDNGQHSLRSKMRWVTIEEYEQGKEGLIADEFYNQRRSTIDDDYAKVSEMQKKKEEKRRKRPKR